MKPIAAEYAKGFFSWRNESSDSVANAIGKRLFAEVVGIPLFLTAAAVETVARTLFWIISPGLSLIAPDFAAQWGSVELLKDSARLIPFFALCLIDNIYSASLDKDHALFLHAYTKIYLAGSN